MSNYIGMYHAVFNAATDALRELEVLNVGKAKAILRQGQLRAEDMVLNREEPADFISAVTPYTKEQLLALLGEAPMTQELFNGILEGCFRWSEVSAFGALEGRYPELVEVYEEAHRRG